LSESFWEAILPSQTSALRDQVIELRIHKKVYHRFILDAIFKSNWLLLLDLIHGRKTGGYIDISWIPEELENLC
jgi:hypothetical protein